jgi:hypothetical protein
MWHNLLTADFRGNRHWVLTEPLKYTISNFIDRTYIKVWEGIGLQLNFDSTLNELTITVPKGFNTDLASIARPMWSIISPWDVARSAVLHDMLYGIIRENKEHLSTTRIRTLRKQADKIFKQGMHDANPVIPSWKIGTCYYFVRSLGWASMIKAAKFKQNAKHN